MLLDAYRILDLTDYRGQLCGKVLADLGADVIKIEPPGGDPGRRMGPFLNDDPHEEKSLTWFAHNTNKRSITLDLAKEDGRRLFREMAKKASFLIESFSPGHGAKLGLCYDALSKLNPSLIMISITPFGRTGPYRDFKDCDLINMGMGGQMTLCGDADRPPLRFPAEQSYGLGSMNAALAALAAHHYREKTGKGQHIDVSVQESVLLTTLNLHSFWELLGIHLERGGSRNMRGERSFRICWQCKDGHISWRFFTGSWAKWTRPLVAWMEEEGIAGELARVPWEDMDMNRMHQDEIERFEKRFEAFFLRHTRKDLSEGARRRGLPLFPVNNAADLLGDEQLRARGFWREVDYPQWGLTLKSPGPAIQSGNEVYTIRRAPQIGEHNQEIYMEELGLSRKSLVMLKGAGVI